MADTKMKIVYDKGDNKTESKTFNNINAEATNDNLADAAEQFTALQDKVVKEVQRIDTSVIG